MIETLLGGLLGGAFRLAPGAKETLSLRFVGSIDRYRQIATRMYVLG